MPVEFLRALHGDVHEARQRHGFGDGGREPGRAHRERPAVGQPRAAAGGDRYQQARGEGRRQRGVHAQRRDVGDEEAQVEDGAEQQGKAEQRAGAGQLVLEEGGFRGGMNELTSERKDVHGNR